MAWKTPAFVPEQIYQAQDTLAAKEIEHQKPMPEARMPLDTMWGLHQGVAESRKIAREADVNRRRCSHPSYQRAPWQPLLEDRTGQIPLQSESCRAARSNHCGTTSDCS